MKHGEGNTSETGHTRGPITRCGVAPITGEHSPSSHDPWRQKGLCLTSFFMLGVRIWERQSRLPWSHWLTYGRSPTCVSPLVNRALPCTRGSTPQEVSIGRMSVGVRPSLRLPSCHAQQTADSRHQTAESRKQKEQEQALVTVSNY